MAKKRASTKKRSPPKTKSKSHSLKVDALETQSLIIIDDRGRKRLFAGHLPGPAKTDGVTILQVFDHQERVRLELQVEDRGSAIIRLCTADDVTALSLTASDGVGNGLSINDEERRPAIMLGVRHTEIGNPRGPRLDIVDWAHRLGWSHWAGRYPLGPA